MHYRFLQVWQQELASPTSYASPFSFIEEMIRSGRFDEFVVKFVETTNKEEEERFQWEFFLHRVFDQSYQDYVEEIKNNKKNLSMTKRTIETTVQDSLNILNNFSPEEGGE